MRRASVSFKAYTMLASFNLNLPVVTPSTSLAWRAQVGQGGGTGVGGTGRRDLAPEQQPRLAVYTENQLLI